jgi:hypothetical protein
LFLYDCFFLFIQIRQKETSFKILATLALQNGCVRCTYTERKAAADWLRRILPYKRLLLIGCVRNTVQKAAADWLCKKYGDKGFYTDWLHKKYHNKVC